MTNPAIRRRSDVVSRVEGSETLVLDLATQTAHCLSGDVAAVWGSGETSTAAIAGATGLSSEAVESAVGALRELGLVTAPSGVSRRTLITRGAAVGGAVVAAGAISIPLPAAARANSATIALTNRVCGAGQVLSYTLTITGLTAGATYKVSVTYNTNGGGTATDVLTNGAVATGGTLTFNSSTSGHYQGAMTVTVTNTSVPSDTRVNATPSGNIASC